jgi:hypothetical protein
MFIFCILATNIFDFCTLLHLCTGIIHITTSDVWRLSETPFTAAITVKLNRSYLITYAGTKTSDSALCTFVLFYDLTCTTMHISIFIHLNLTLSAWGQTHFQYQLYARCLLYTYIWMCIRNMFRCLCVIVRENNCASSLRNQPLLWHCFLWVPFCSLCFRNINIF